MMTRLTCLLLILACTAHAQIAADSTQNYLPPPAAEFGTTATIEDLALTRGNSLTPTALVEAAWRLVRFQPNYRVVVKWHHLLGKGALASGPARKP